jgi:hypothetical protein
LGDSARPTHSAGVGGRDVAIDDHPRLIDGLNRRAPTWAAWVRIAVGIALTRHQVTKQPASLSRLTPVGAAAIANGLILVNPKVLLMNAAEGLVIGTASLGVPGAWVTGVYYTVIAGSSVVPRLRHRR